MTTPELRGEPRLNVGQQPDGAMFLCFGAERRPVREVLDISPAGVSVLLEGSAERFADTLRVSIEYRSRELAIGVSGTVAWCHQEENRSPAGGSGPLCRLGIKLMSPQLLYSFMQGLRRAGGQLRIRLQSGQFGAGSGRPRRGLGWSRAGGHQDRHETHECEARSVS